MFSETLLANAAKALEAANKAGVRIAVAETCTAGLLSACITSIPGASNTFERGFVLYHSSAKATGLDVDAEISKKHGAVSAEVTHGLAEGTLQHSTAGVSAAITGYAGPGGGNEQNPVGTCYIATSGGNKPTTVQRHVFPGSRDEVRLAAVGAALNQLAEQLS